MTNREKIINYLSEHGIDIIPYEVTESYADRYQKPGMILIRKWYNIHEDVYRAVDDLCTYDSPLRITTPYYKDAFGNVEPFKRDHCYARISWKGDRK